MVELNRAVAMAKGPELRLLAVEAIVREGGLAHYVDLHSTRPDFLKRRDEASSAYRAALGLAKNAREVSSLQSRLEGLTRS
ncbi:MAG: putative RNA polymerase sigma factor [Gammaproteobacteria bacterium]